MSFVFDIAWWFCILLVVDIVIVGVLALYAWISDRRRRTRAEQHARIHASQNGSADWHWPKSGKHSTINHRRY